MKANTKRDHNCLYFQNGQNCLKLIFGNSMQTQMEFSIAFTEIIMINLTKDFEKMYYNFD